MLITPPRGNGGRSALPNLWTDAWLAALSESLAIGLSTFDTGFQSFSLHQIKEEPRMDANGAAKPN